jgi:hypothetical protein
MTLSIPFAKGFADLYRPNGMTFGPRKVDVKQGTIPAEGVAHDFHASVWIGNTRRGFDWFAENMRGWYVGGDFITKNIEVENGADGVTLHVHFIRTNPEKALLLEKPRQIVFGLMATRHGRSTLKPFVTASACTTPSPVTPKSSTTTSPQA